MNPYYDADGVTLYHGDALALCDVWDLAHDAVMVTDPPYGRAWKQGRLSHWRHASDAHVGIAGDADTSTRDAVLDVWGERPAIVFGDLMLPPPPRTRQVLVYRKAPNSGIRGATAGVRRDVEAVYLVGRWPSGISGGRSSVLSTVEPSQGNPYSPAGRWHHPHAKPLDVMLGLLGLCAPEATVVDPFAGSGSTLVAAKRLRRCAVGVEVEERYCATARRRLGQSVLDVFEVTT